MESAPNGSLSADARESSLKAPPASADMSDKQAVLRLHPGLFLVGMIVCGGIFMAVAELMFPVYLPPPELMVAMPPPEIAVAREASMARCRLANATIAMGAFALIIGLVIGAGESAARRFGGGALLRMAPALLLAVALGTAGALLGHVVAEQTMSMKMNMPLVRTLLVQLALLMVFGAGVGAAIGLVAGGVRGGLSTAILGLTAGFLAAMLFPVASSFLLPRSQTELVIPGGVLWGGRDLPVLALWVGALVVSLAVILPFTNRQTAKTPTPKRKETAAKPG